SPVLTETICSELVISCFNDSMDSWDQGPAATEVEESMIHGLAELYGFPVETSDGCFTSGGSQSNISAIVAARDRYCMERFGWDVKMNGLPPEYSKLRVYTSEISHFSMDKASHILGMGYAAVRKIPVDSKCRIDLKEFERMLKEDTDNGLYPFCAVATFGTTDFGSIDDARGMRELCDRYGMHLHADAAYGSGLIMSDKYRDRVADISLCDSLTVDFHKMFLLPISCSAIIVKHAELLECFELHADYLNREEDEEDGYINLVGKSMQTTRRFDALKVFVAFKTRGRDGFGRIIDTAVENASYFYGRISKDDDFIAPVEPEMSSVVFAYNRSDDVNKRIRRQLLKEGIVIGQTVKDGRVMLKFTLLNPNLKPSQIDDIILRIKEMGSQDH
ncbi:pyridoxal phosphate-dependent decarboxylase family protein, partial [Candidatus Methanarcanum hacksteinii]|uniref:pyridoxal phosphate-dependent decarboxylase family protein n=1 Tax=Candidatus Methanarcanum hacksteinii TaxID=2911857 RepID=UPI0037DD6438